MTDDDFIHQYEDFVRHIVARTLVQLGIRDGHEDLLSYAYTGLLEARERYDAGRGTPFKAFAYYRVRGAVIDGVRRMAHMPRRAHARMQALEALDTSAEAQAPNTSEPAPNAAAALGAIKATLDRVTTAYALAQAAGQDPDDQGDDPERSAMLSERRAAVAEEVERLPERERMLIRGYYFEGRHLEDICKEIGVSKSWGSRTHTRALSRLRIALDQSK
ncbi:MAG: sigma-70 family RNA polymerase sigma factor [Myxococcales bacterium]|nr:sigma-70 family RNA polymerase sigma factor [Myxococcales bacterium]